VKCTVPVYPVAVLPEASFAVTTALAATPASTEFGRPETTSVAAVGPRGASDVQATKIKSEVNGSQRRVQNTRRLRVAEGGVPSEDEEETDSGRLNIAD